MKYLFYHTALTFLYLVPLINNGQALKFKEIYPLIEAKNYDDAAARLQEYLIEEPDDPAANLQLALIYERRYKNCHPIYQFELAISYAEKAKDRFLKASLLVDEREIRRKGKRYYTNLARPDDRGRMNVEYSYVRSKIDSAYIEIDNFVRNVPTIHRNFTRGLQFYDKSMNRYTGITAEYSSPLDLYLLFDASLRDELNNLRSDYDSTLFYLNNYLIASENYPVTENKQSLSVKKINNYRIDGYNIQNDFLAGSILVWNYSAWCDTILSVVQNEISALKERINENNHKLEVNLDFLDPASSDLPADFHMHQIDNDLIGAIRKYDQNSLLIPLLLYKNSKQDVLMKMRSEDKWSGESGIGLKAGSKLAYFSNIYNMISETSEYLHQMEKLTNESNLHRYEEFFRDNYHGFSGFYEYLSGEKEFINSQSSAYANKIRKTLVSDMAHYPDTVKPFVYEEKNIPFYRIAPDSLNFPEGMYYTMHIIPSPDSTFYLGGVTTSEKENNHLAGFIAKTGKEEDLSWLKTMEMIPAETDSTLLEELVEGSVDSAHFDNLVSVMELAPEGCAMVLSTRERNSGNILTSVRVLNSKGEEIRSVNFQVNGVARSIEYNEYDDGYMIVFKGDSLFDYNNRPDLITLLKMDSEGNTIWKQEYPFEGNFTDLVQLPDGYLIFGTSYTDQVKKNGNSAGGQEYPGTFILRADQEGNKLDFKSIPTDEPFHLISVYMIDESLISLLGTNDSPEKMTGEDIFKENEIRQILINAHLEVYSIVE